jgi:Mn-dependent DtxR family transcriptional regulator
LFKKPVVNFAGVVVDCFSWSKKMGNRAISDSQFETWKVAKIGDRLPVPDVGGCKEVEVIESFDCKDCYFGDTCVDCPRESKDAPAICYRLGVGYKPIMTKKQEITGVSVGGYVQPKRVEIGTVTSPVVNPGLPMADRVVPMTDLAEKLAKAGNEIAEIDEAIKTWQEKREQVFGTWSAIYAEMAELIKRPTGVTFEMTFKEIKWGDVTLSPHTPTGTLLNNEADAKAFAAAVKKPRRGLKYDILAYFQNERPNDVVTMDEVENVFMSIPRGSISGRMSDLYKEGLIEYVDSRRYRLTESGKTGYSFNPAKIESKLFKRKPTKESKAGSREAKALELIKGAAADGCVATNKELSAVFGISESKMAVTLSALVRKGSIKRVGRGQYAPVDNANA